MRVSGVLRYMAVEGYSYCSSEGRGFDPLGHPLLADKTQPLMVVAQDYGSGKLLDTFPMLDRRTSGNFELRPESQITTSNSMRVKPRSSLFTL